MAATGAPVRVPVAVACRVLKLSTSGYDKWLKAPVSQRDWDDAHAINALWDIHADDPTLGYRFLTDELEDVGITASENRVWRLTSIAGIVASHHRRRGKGGKPGPAVHEDLLASVDEKGRASRTTSPGQQPARTTCGSPASANTPLVRARSTFAQSRTCTRTRSSGTQSTRG